MKRFWKLLPVLLLVCILLCACGETAEQPVETASYTVSFLVGDEVYNTQTVPQGKCPAPVQVDINGLRFEGWQNVGGNPVQPETVAVQGDTTYTAKGTATLSRHMPYLQVDEVGFLRPEDLLTADELQYALDALTEEAARAFLPQVPTTENISGEQLKEVLTVFFPAETVTATVTCADTDSVTRAMFAGYMHKLLGRDDAEKFVLGAGEKVPEDVTILRNDVPALLEACLRHTTDPEGQQWTDIPVTSGWEPGLHLMDGWLFYVQPNGSLLRNGQLDNLQFGPDGRYTSGDEELDILVADILSRIVEENPDLEGLDLLRKVFDHCHQSYKYVRKDAYLFGQTGWEIEDAKEMFQKGRGNCYNFAAIFWALAQGMGYDVQCLAGTCTGTDQPHGWVVLHYEDAYYFVDPEWQYAYTEREVFDKDMFMLTMDEVWWWTYRWDKTQFYG